MIRKNWETSTFKSLVYKYFIIESRIKGYLT